MFVSQDAHNAPTLRPLVVREQQNKRQHGLHQLDAYVDSVSWSEE